MPRSGHTAVVSDDAEAAVAALRDAGFDPQPGSNAWNAPRWFVHDPAGHRVEVMSAPPAVETGLTRKRGPACSS